MTYSAALGLQVPLMPNVRLSPGVVVRGQYTNLIRSSALPTSLGNYPTNLAQYNGSRLGSAQI